MKTKSNLKIFNDWNNKVGEERYLGNISPSDLTTCLPDFFMVWPFLFYFLVYNILKRNVHWQVEKKQKFMIKHKMLKNVLTRN